MTFGTVGRLFSLLSTLAVTASVGAVAAQTPSDGISRPEARAVRVADGSIRLDGRLDESIWQTAPALTRFVQKEPDERAPATDRTEIRFVYDDDALYVGARMWSTGAVQAPLGRRDGGDQSEHLIVSLDTYLNRRTASTFGVTASGVRLDRYHSTDDDFGDDGFDPVWQARSIVDENGWTAELWIPFSQLRFNDRSPQIWGLNVRRWVPSRNEDVYWALVPRTERGWASRFGDLVGIDGIGPRRRLEILPYVASSAHVVGARDAANPFDAGANVEGRVGLDMKVGLGSDLTLEATANPDFGQVEADPAEVNLSAFETFFSEKRPFFLEGSQLLAGRVNNYFYSRRIGAPPAGRASGDFVEHPATSTILGAAKLTGRLSSGTSIAVLGAVTGAETARTFRLPDAFGRQRVAPRTLFGVARVEQEFGPPGSTWSIMTTAMHRDLEPGEPLGALLTRNAAALSGDTVLRLNGGDYQVNAFSGITYVEGETQAIDRVQRTSRHYLDRPDADHLRYDPLRTTLSGTKSGLMVEKRNGRHWLWQMATQIETPEFEPSDLGRLTSTDAIVGNARIEYRDTVPRPWWRNYSIELGSRNEWSFGGDRQVASLDANAEVTWPNFWTTQSRTQWRFRTQDARLTRGGPLMETPRGWGTSLEMATSEAAQTRAGGEVSYGRDEDGGNDFQVDAGFDLRPAPQWSLSIRPAYQRQVNTQQYVTTRDGGSASTFGSRYIFARIDRTTYSVQARLSYTFKPDLTLDLYAEPFAASGRYDDFGELAAARTRLLRRYGAGGTTLDLLPDGARRVTDGATTFSLANRDFNVRSFRSNLVLKWEWRPGSTLYLVWQQDRSEEKALSTVASLGDLFASPAAPGDNFFIVKASVWIAR